jgi:hypothetical protein
MRKPLQVGFIPLIDAVVLLLSAFRRAVRGAGVGLTKYWACLFTAYFLADCPLKQHEHEFT